jgi:transcription initiation factor TFIID subunit TAF12
VASLPTGAGSCGASFLPNQSRNAVRSVSRATVISTNLAFPTELAELHSLQGNAQSSRQATSRKGRISTPDTPISIHDYSGVKYDEANIHQNGTAAMAVGHVEGN